MQLHVKAKRMALAGLMLALTVFFMFLGSVIETNTLFLLAAASYFVGAVIHEAGFGFGAAFFIAAVLLGLIAAPNKLYVVSFSAMGMYIIIFELSFRFIAKTKDSRRWAGIFWAAKYLFFNLIFLPAVLLFQRLLFGRTLSAPFLAGIILAGQLGIYVFDRAYLYFRRNTWPKIRRLTID